MSESTNTVIEITDYHSKPEICILKSILTFRHLKPKLIQLGDYYLFSDYFSSLKEAENTL